MSVFQFRNKEKINTSTTFYLVQFILKNFRNKDYFWIINQIEYYVTLLYYT